MPIFTRGAAKIFGYLIFAEHQTAISILGRETCVPEAKEGGGEREGGSGGKTK